MDVVNEVVCLCIVYEWYNFRQLEIMSKVFFDKIQVGVNSEGRRQAKEIMSCTVF